MLAAALIVVCGAAGAALFAAGVGQGQTYLTHPLSIVAMSGAAVGIALLAARLVAAGAPSGARWLGVLATSVAVYLVLGAIAMTISGPATPVVVAVWSVWWVVPSVVVQLAALRVRRIARRFAVALGCVTAIAAVVGAVTTVPERPFEGLQPVAPDAWTSSGLSDVAAALLFVALLAPPIGLVIRAARSDVRARGRDLLAAAAAAVPPLLVIVCVGLAVIRDPGGVEPVFGSVGYLVALSSGCLGAAIGLARAEGVRPTPATIRRVVGGVVGGYATVFIVLLGTGLAGVLAADGSFWVAVVVIAVVAVAYAGWLLATRAIVGLSAERDDERPRARVRDLSAREAEVLELVAQGARDAEVAARLHLSERTVEAHLRRIYLKLGLDADEGRNRRLVAARAFLEAGADRG